MKRNIKLSVIVLTIGFAAAMLLRGHVAEAQTQPATPQTQVITAGQSPKYKNIKVLNDMPADQLGRVMNLWAASLGVDCDFCHVTSDFSKDDKRNKATAREMVKMVMNINKESFNNRPRITCNSCHNGHNEPRPVPALDVIPMAEERPAQPTTKPTADQIFDKYTEALGGKEKIDKITSVVETGTRTERDGKEVHQETRYYQPGKYALKTVYPQGTLTELYDGTTVHKFGRQPIELRPDEQEQIKREASVFSPASLKAAYTRVDFLGVDKVDGRLVNIMSGITAGNQRERLYFDAETGLLVRRTMTSQTMFGTFPLQVDYSDYKVFNGVKMPTTIKYAMPNLMWTRHITTVKVNAPIEASVFQAPAGPAGGQN